MAEHGDPCQGTGILSAEGPTNPTLATLGVYGHAVKYNVSLHVLS